MKKVIVLNKKEGETPLQALSLFRKKHRAYQDVPMTYAGRLDPMASGLLIILAGEECKNKEKYLKLSKEYEFEVLFGFTTDTYDILGKINNGLIRTNRRIVSQKDLESEIKMNLNFFKGKFIQKYPMYSSKTVKGKQLFEYARSGEKVEAPKHEVTVRSLKFNKIREITNVELLKNIEKRVSRVQGDFRQKEIIKIWQKNLKNKNPYSIAKFKIRCSSGTYVRSIANGLGEKTRTPALAFSIKRTKIGKYKKL